MLPETYVIDREVYIARKFVGPQRWDSAEITKHFDATLSQNWHSPKIHSLEFGAAR